MFFSSLRTQNHSSQPQVSLDLKREFPDSTNFSVRNLWYMKQWYLFYAENLEKLKQLVSVMWSEDDYNNKIKQIADEEKLKQSVSEFPLPFARVPWGHHVCIVQHSKNIEEALFYVGYTIREGISRDTIKYEARRNKTTLSAIGAGGMRFRRCGMLERKGTV